MYRKFFFAFSLGAFFCFSAVEIMAAENGFRDDRQILRNNNARIRQDKRDIAHNKYSLRQDYRHVGPESKNQKRAGLNANRLKAYPGQKEMGYDRGNLKAARIDHRFDNRDLKHDRRIFQEKK
jgi:hypothetical protein